MDQEGISTIIISNNNHLTSHKTVVVMPCAHHDRYKNSYLRIIIINSFNKWNIYIQKELYTFFCVCALTLINRPSIDTGIKKARTITYIPLLPYYGG